MNGKKFVLGKAPFIRKADLTSQHTSGFMRDLIIALIPLIIFGWVKNGLLPFINEDTNFLGMIYPLLLPLCGGLFSLLLELGWWKFIVTNKPLKERMQTSYAVIPGLMLGMIVSVSTPIWVLFIGTIFATVVTKLLFGGFGHNIFNPALIGFVFLTTYSYFGLMNGASSFGSKGYLNPSEILAGATPLTAIKNPAEYANIFVGFEAMLEKYGLFNLFLGLNPGAVAETSALLCLVGLVYLLVRKVINWRIPVIYIGTVFVLTYIVGAFNGYAGTLNFALFNVLTGGLMYGAVFMATEPVTSPRNPNGKVIYALGLGVLTVVFRFASNNPEGVAVSILALNMFTAIIERLATKLRVEPNKKKVVLTYSLIGLLFAGISVLPIVKSIPEPVVVPAYELLENEQDFSTLDFVYKFKSDDVEFTVTTTTNHEIKEISNAKFDNDEAKAALLEIINDNKIVNYVQSANEGEDFLELTVITLGFHGNITNKITYDDSFVITAFVVTYDESYTNYDEWINNANGVHPKDKIPADIIANQDNLDNVAVVTGASVTSNAIKKAVEVGQGYIDYLSSLTELTLVGKSQDFDTLDFKFVFRNSDGKVIVLTDTDYEIKSVVPAEILSDVETAIENNKFDAYYVSKTENTIVVRTKGFKNPITTTFTFDAEYKITNVVTNNLKDENTGESYPKGEWAYIGEDVHPQDKIPAEIVAKQDNLGEIEVVSGASVTSRSIIKAAEMALEYLNYLEGADE